MEPGHRRTKLRRISRYLGKPQFFEQQCSFPQTGDQLLHVLRDLPQVRRTQADILRQCAQTAAGIRDMFHHATLRFESSGRTFTVLLEKVVIRVLSSPPAMMLYSIHSVSVAAMRFAVMACGEETDASAQDSSLG